MYPLADGLIYAYNQWYMAAWSHEIGRALLLRQILGIPLVLYRTEDGEAVAFDDRCPHRRFSLSKGRLDGDTIECGYHGFTFDRGGHCVRIPAQNNIPNRYAVRKYPLHERWEWIWIWMGDPALADPALIPSTAKAHLLDPGWTARVGGTAELDARFVLVHENLLDLSHLTFLHNDNIGSPGVAMAKAEVEQHPDHLSVTRCMRKEEISHLPLGKVLGVTGPVNRQLAQQFYPPGLHITGSAYTAETEDGSEGRYYGGYRIMHVITPVTPHRTRYFYAFNLDFRPDDAVLTQMLKVLSSALPQDIEASETIERNLSSDTHPDARHDLYARSDAASVRGRAMIEAQIRSELNAGLVAGCVERSDQSKASGADARTLD